MTRMMYWASDETPVGPGAEGEWSDPEKEWPGAEKEWPPDFYRIQVTGLLRAGWTTWFEGLTVNGQVDEHGVAVTTLSGEVVDQAQLHSILARIRDLGLTLLLVERVEPSRPQLGKEAATDFTDDAASSAADL